MIDTFRILATSLGARVRVVLGRLRGVGTLGAPNDAEAIDDAEVLFPLGYVSRPKFATSADETHDAIGFRDGDEVLVIAIRKKSAGLLTASPSMLEGETRVHAAGEVLCMLRLLPDGNIEVRAKSGQDVKLFADGQTADKPVAKEGSGTTGHTHAAGTLVAGPYAVTGATASASDTIAVGQGAQRVKVPSG